MAKTASTDAPFWKRAVALLLKSVIAAGLVFICWEIGVWLHPPLLAWGLSLPDRQQVCSPTEALQGAEKHARVTEDSKELMAKSHLIETEGKRLDHWSTPRGDWWVPKDSDEPAIEFLAQQQNKIYGDGPWGVQKGDIVLDCGAHVGVYTREALNSGASLVIAIEPAPVNVECLRRNFQREIAEKRVIVAPVGVWDKKDKLPLYEDPLNSGGDSFVIHGPNDRVTGSVPLTTVDQIAKQYNLPRVDFIKMDIKGATTRALTGARNTLTTSRPRLALSTEELEDNPWEIRAAVMALQPSYHVACGICSVGATLKVNADVLLFRP
jgi:FkbM family methyltransferase